jgi:hypothetical protein
VLESGERIGKVSAEVGAARLFAVESSAYEYAGQGEKIGRLQVADGGAFHVGVAEDVQGGSEARGAALDASLGPHERLKLQPGDGTGASPNACCCLENFGCSLERSYPRIRSVCIE